MSQPEQIDVRDMAIVHKSFRRTFAESAELVSAKDQPSAERVAFLADHIDFTLTLLHLHHGGEDQLLWPVLLERAPEEATMVQRVADQHQGVSVGIDQVRATCQSWQVDPTEDSGAALSSALVSLSTVLNQHLDEEEQLVVPLAARTMSQDEWRALGEHARAGIPQERMFIAFGMLLEPLTDDEQAVLMGEVPPPVQELWRSVGQPSWDDYAARLRSIA